MSKQVGIIKLKGNMGGISFYQSEGADLARVANGPSRERILNDPAFQRTRENNKEFGGSATAAKALRLALNSAIHTVADPRLVSRLTKVFREILNSGTGPRGERTILLSANGHLILNLEFNKKDSLGNVFTAPYTVSNNIARTEGTVTIPNFLPANSVKAPPGATHFRLVHAIGAVSDFAFDPAVNHYEPLEPTANAIGAVSYSAMTALNVTVPVTFTLVTELPGPPTMTADTNGVQCLGIEFFQQINSVDYILAQSNCLRVVGVF